MPFVRVTFSSAEWELAKVHSVYEIKSGGGMSPNQEKRYRLLTDNGKKLFMLVSEYRYRPGPGVFVLNNQKTMLSHALSVVGAGLAATTVASMINGEYLDQFNLAMAKADIAVMWAAKMANGNATQNDRFTYPHKVSDFMGEMNSFIELLIGDAWDIDGARIAEKVIVEQMYLQWVSQ